MNVDGRSRLVSRVLLAGKLGRPIAAGLCAIHSCDRPWCVAVEHLREGTHAENMREAGERGRMQSGARHWTSRSPGSVPKGERNSHAKLTGVDVVQIREARAAGESLADLSERFGVDPSIISKIARRRIWRHV